MRLKLLVLVVVLMAPPAAWAGDYMVELFEEHYKEMAVPGLGDLKVNHTWQVKTAFGSKVLILQGNDYNQRQWLRQYKGNHRLWVVKIPDEGDDRFKYNMAVYVDVHQIQPVWEAHWKCEGCRDGAPPEPPPPPPPPVEPEGPLLPSF